MDAGGSRQDLAERGAALRWRLQAQTSTTENGAVKHPLTNWDTWCSMVLRRRLWSILLPLALYAVSASASTYFIWHAWNGNRGMKAKVEFRAEARALQRELNELKAERSGLERRITMMRAESVERDILEEEARRQLGRVHRNDVVVFLPQPN